MAGVDVYVTVEDITTKMLTYESIELHRCATLGGNYALEETEALVAGTYYYAINDADGTLNHWYKYRFHHATGPVNSEFSNPFRVDGVTRLRTRQAALAKYGAGIVLVNTGTDSDKLTTADYRLASSFFTTDRGKGSWVYVATGTRLGDARIVSGSTPSDGELEVNPDFSGALANGDEVEWHTLADPTVWADAINRGLARYFFLDRVPIKGVANQDEYSLASVPWIISEEQVHDVRHYPLRASGADDGVDQPYGVNGKWWKIRQDRDALTLIISPTIAATEVLYLEATRPMPPLWTDASAAPPICAEELVAALAYDEVLSYLSRPANGTAEERKTWQAQRKDHLPELHRLLRKHRPRPRYSPPQLPFPPVVPQPFQAR